MDLAMPGEAGGAAEVAEAERIDVFVRSWIPSGERRDLRHSMAVLVHGRWWMQKDAKVYLQRAHSTDSNGSQFHMEAKRFAEEHAAGDVYIVADDDCLILGRTFVADGVRILRANPAYGLLTAVSVIENANLIAEWDTWSSDRSTAAAWPSEIIDRHSVGGVAFVRRGILKTFAACEPRHTDETICREIEAAGFRVGVMPGVRMNHLGFRYGASGPYWEA
jgi:hypothetical protein